MKEQGIRPVLNKALSDRRISRYDWEMVFDLAIGGDFVVLNGDKNDFERLVSLLEGGEIVVEGISHREILSRLSVFA